MSGELARQLGSGDGGQVARACDDVARQYQGALGLTGDDVAAVLRAAGPGRKAARLAGALRR